MNLDFYKDQTEKDIRKMLEELIIEAEEFSYLAEKAESQNLKEIYLQKARAKKAEMKWLVKAHFEKNPANNLLENITKEFVQVEKLNKTRDGSLELKRLAHIKNIIRKGRWVFTKKPTVVKAEEFFS